jgi:hypothetical protein
MIAKRVRASEPARPAVIFGVRQTSAGRAAVEQGNDRVIAGIPPLFAAHSHLQ